MSQAGAFEGILAYVHRAALDADPAHWPATASLIGEAVGPNGNALVVGKRAADHLRVFFVRHLYLGESHNARVNAYFDIYHPGDEELPVAREGNREQMGRTPLQDVRLL